MTKDTKKHGKSGPNTGELRGCIEKQKKEHGKHQLAARTTCAVMMKSKDKKNGGGGKNLFNKKKY